MISTYLQVAVRAARLAFLQGEVGELGEDGRLVHVRRLAERALVQLIGLLQVCEGGALVAAPLRHTRELLQGGSSPADSRRVRVLRLKRVVTS